MNFTGAESALTMADGVQTRDRSEIDSISDLVIGRELRGKRDIGDDGNGERECVAVPVLCAFFWNVLHLI